MVSKGVTRVPVLKLPGWAGYDLPARLQAGLTQGKPRWNDPQYLTRILFDNMTRGERGETGYGISATIGDGADAVLMVDTGTERVKRGNQSWTFAEFVAIPDITWDKLAS